MNTWITNESSGRFLYAELTGLHTDFEEKMLSSFEAAGFLLPKVVYADGKRCMRTEISGLISLKEHLNAHKLDFTFLTSIFIQIGDAASTLKNYLLSENDLLLDSETVFMEEESTELNFCVIPDDTAKFEDSVKKFLTELLSKLDNNDPDSLSLGFKMLNAASSPDFRFYDLLNVIKKFKPSGAAAAADEGAYDQTRYDGNLYGHEPAVETDSFFDDTDLMPESGLSLETRKKTLPAKEKKSKKGKKDRRKSSPKARKKSRKKEVDIDDSAPDTEDDKLKAFKSAVIGIIIAQVILFSGLMAIYFLKGMDVVLRILPIYIVLAVSVTLYFLADFVILLIKKSKN